MQENNQNSIGPIAGVVLVIAILAIGGFYFFGKELSQRTEAPSAEEILSAPDQALQNLQTQGTSDEVTAIEADLTSTNLENLDAELNTIETELNF
ncbi:MAG TPA: hypothetical protein VJB70_05295 [Candidatus Paceibacterota bacterium]